MLTLTPETWIISDTHFGHKNIVKYCGRPLDHNSIMVNEWKTLVRPEDTILHLGDVAVWYGPESDYWHSVVSDLPGDKYMLRGNHDLRKDKVYALWGLNVVPEFVQEFDGRRVLFSHYPDETRIGDWDINIHGHIHNNSLEPRLAASGRRYINVSVEVMGYRPVRLGDLI